MPGYHERPHLYHNLLVDSLLKSEEEFSLKYLDIIQEILRDLNCEVAVQTSPDGVYPPTFQKVRPLDAAIQFGNITVLNKMFEMGVEFDYQMDELSPLHRAQIFQRTEVIQAILKRAPKLCFSSDSKLRTPLHFAIIQDNAKSLDIYLRALVELTIQEKEIFNINWIGKDREDNTLLHFAGANNALECAKLLINYWGADKRSLNRLLQTPFIYSRCRCFENKEKQKQLFDLLQPGPFSLFEQCAYIVGQLPKLQQESSEKLPFEINEAVSSITAQFEARKAYIKNNQAYLDASIEASFRRLML